MKTDEQDNSLVEAPEIILTLDILNLSEIQTLNKVKIDDMDFMRNPLLTNYIHPNCIAFDDAESSTARMFVGDSIGYIRCWDISYYN